MFSDIFSEKNWVERTLFLVHRLCQEWIGKGGIKIKNKKFMAVIFNHREKLLAPLKCLQRLKFQYNLWVKIKKWSPRVVLVNSWHIITCTTIYVHQAVIVYAFCQQCENKSFSLITQFQAAQPLLCLLCTHGTSPDGSELESYKHTVNTLPNLVEG